MNFKIQALWTFIVYLNLSIVLTNSIDTDVLITDLAKHVTRDDLRTRSVTIVSRSPIGNLSTLSLRLVQKIINSYPSLLITDSSPVRRRFSCRSSRWLLLLRAQRSTVNVVLVEQIKGANFSAILAEHLDFLVNITPKMSRAKCVFIFFHEIGTSLELKDFFRYAWSKKFLNIVLIELMRSKMSREMLTPLRENFVYQAILHQYNPFTDTYERNILPQGIKSLFVDKLRNLHGFLLKVGMFDDIPTILLARNFTGRGIWDVVQGLDVSITRTLVETMNFTVVIEVTDSNSPAWPYFNVSYEFIDDAIKNERIDFCVNFYGIIGSTTVEDFFFESSIVLYPFTNHVIVKQYANSNLKVSYNLAVIVGAVILVVMIIASGIWLLGYDSKTWTTYNITKVLIGNAIKPEPRQPLERLAFVSLAFVSSLFSVQILEELFDRCLWQESFKEFATLDDLLHSGIVPSITNDTKLLNTYNYTTLEKLFNESSTIESEDKVTLCLESLISNELRSVNGCEVDGTLGRFVARGFSHMHEGGWIISFVEEPLVQPCWAAMIFTKQSPYVEGFNSVLRRFSEAGLIDFWSSSGFRNFTRIYRDYFGDHRMQLSISASHRNRHLARARQVPLSKKVLGVVIIGEFVSCIIFLCEIVVGSFK